MSFIYSVIYHPKVNWLIRNVNHILSPVLPKKIRINPSGIVTIPVKGHKPLKFKTNQTNYLTAELFWNGVLKFEYTPIFMKLIKKVDTFFDIGGSIGYYSVLGSKINPKLKVQAFEPSLSSRQFFSENIKLNHLEEHITLNGMALSDKEGTIDFHVVKSSKYPSVPNLSGQHNLDAVHNNLKSETITVDTDTLDNFVKKNNIQNIDLIKIDTEGTENRILGNAAETIERFKPIIISEVLFDQIEAELEEIILKHQYEFYNHVNGKLQKASGLKRETDNGVRDCFFVHPSKKHLIEEFIAQ